jgi:hypothetical protein
MKPNPTARKLIAELKATLVSNDPAVGVDYNVDAPEGFQWACRGVHSLCVRSFTTSKADLAEMWESAIRDMQAGLLECPADCDCRE